jgi:hypothetical protein
MGEADVQLIAAVAGGGVAEGAGLGPHAPGPEQPGQRVGGGDPGAERTQKLHQAASKRKSPRTEHFQESPLRPGGVRAHQHVAVQEIAMY